MIGYGSDWGQMKAAPVAYDVVSFLPTQTSSTRLMVLGDKKSARGLLQGRCVLDRIDQVTDLPEVA